MRPQRLAVQLVQWLASRSARAGVARCVQVGAAVGLSVCLGLSGCAASGDFGGVWRGVAPKKSADNLLVFGDNGAPLAVELVLGEYGNELAGLVRFFRDDSFLRTRSQDSPDLQCACVLVRDGHSDAALGKAALTLIGCLPGGSPKAVVRALASLTTTVDGVQLKLAIADTNSRWHGASMDMVLTRVGGSGDITGPDLACPAGTATGNPASGQ